MTTVPTETRLLATRLACALRRFGRSDSGATAIEYGLIAGLIFLATVSGINLYAAGAQGVYDKLSTAVSAK